MCDPITTVTTITAKATTAAAATTTTTIETDAYQVNVNEKLKTSGKRFSF